MDDPTIRHETRSMIAEWGIDPTHVATLSVYHHGNSKSFSATLRQEEVDVDLGFRSFIVTGGIAIARERVARYSEKALRDFFQRALAETVRAKQDGEYAHIFNPPAEEQAA